MNGQSTLMFFIGVLAHCTAFPLHRVHLFFFLHLACSLFFFFTVGFIGFIGLT
jgi:hypothetical protein